MNFKHSFTALTLALGAFSLSGYSQEKGPHFCGQHTVQEQLMHEHPEMAESIIAEDEKLDSFTQAFEKTGKRSARSTYVIPIVFHIIHMNGPENISDAQVLDCVRIINEDFNARNADLSEVVPSFQNIIGDADIEFRLARLDPNGIPTNGIDRIQSPETNVGDDGSKLNGWPRDRYINIWVCNQINGAPGAAAYAYLPSGAHSFPSRDGIISNHRYVGSIGTSSVSGMHTISHELGHVLNLRHPWGPTNEPGLSSNCNFDDGVTDTPNTIGTFGSCNTSQVSCGSLDNVQNLMDYASCDRMFTEGQVNRMHAALNSSTAQRNNLWTVGNLQQTGVYDLVSANFGAVDPTICEGETVDFIDFSEYGAESWSWTFFNAETSASIDENPSIQYKTRGSYTVALNATQGSTTRSETKVGYVMVKPTIGYAMPLQESFEATSFVPNEYWYAMEERHFENFGWGLNSSNGYNGSKCIKMENFNAPEEVEFTLESTTWDLSVYTSATVTFKYAHARKTSTDGDRLTVYASTDCGATWAPRFARFAGTLATAGTIGGNYTPQSNADWDEVSFPLTGSMLGDATQLKFVFESGGGNNLYLDDINITGTFTDQAQLDYPYDGLTDRGASTNLFWKPMPCDQYQLQLDTDPAFSNPTSVTQDFIALSPGTDTRYDATGLTPSETYYWRVRLLTGPTPGPWSETWSFTVADNGVGMNEQSDAGSLSVYPNPSESMVNVSFTGETGVGSLVITDLFGRVVYNEKMNVNNGILQLNTAQWSSGLYIVNLTLNDAEYQQKLVVRH